MRHVAFINDKMKESRRLPFFLALEEWVARTLPADDYFFSWQVDPTVICGRNQEIDKEVNLGYCRRNGIDVVRRRSGGGCVFADRQNFMFSLVTSRADSVIEVFAGYTAMIADALRSLGLDASASGRNDITIGGKKVSGNAFYYLPGRSIAHGTMLYDFDPASLSGALTPSKAKLESKGVKSVPMRVTCLKDEGIGLDPAGFERYMIERLTEGDPYYITEADICQIRKIEQGYYNPSFLRINGDGIDSGHVAGRRRMGNKAMIKGVGEFYVEFDLDPASSVISGLSITGDFFMSGDVESRICRRLDGVGFNSVSIREVLTKAGVEEVIPGLDPDVLAGLMLDAR